MLCCHSIGIHKPTSQNADLQVHSKIVISIDTNGWFSTLALIELPLLVRDLDQSSTKSFCAVRWHNNMRAQIEMHASRNVQTDPQVVRYFVTCTNKLEYSLKTKNALIWLRHWSPAFLKLIAHLVLSYSMSTSPPLLGYSIVQKNAAFHT